MTKPDTAPAPQLTGATYSQAEYDEAYKIGKRDGYSEAVQQIDQLTGGDGEYRYCLGDEGSVRHTPGPSEMIQRIIDRFETLNLLDDATKSGRDQVWGDTAPSAQVTTLPQDVIDLVIAAREVAYSEPEHETLHALDKAVEAFAEHVPWDNDPEVLAAAAPPDNGTPHEVLSAVLECANARVHEARIIGNVRAGDIARAIDTLFVSMAKPDTAPAPQVMGNE